VLLALLVSSQAAASLRVALGDASDAIVHVVDDPRTGYQLKVDCVARCTRRLHFAVQVGDTPMGLLDLDRDGLIYSVWGTGCCYVVRVWKVSVNGVAKVLESGSRYVPSLITGAALTVVTYMRPTDADGRETATSPRPLRWTYRHGRFERS
jgi:hypothetical protein